MKDDCGGQYFRNSWEGAKDMLFYLGVTAIAGFEKGEATAVKHQGNMNLLRDEFKGYTMKTDSLEMCGQAAVRMNWLDAAMRSEEGSRGGNESFFVWFGIGFAVYVILGLAARDFIRARQVALGVVNVALDWVMSAVIMDNRRLTVLGPLGSLRGGGAESLIGAAKFFTYVSTAMFLIEATVLFFEWQAERKQGVRSANRFDGFLPHPPCSDEGKTKWTSKTFYMKCGGTFLKDIPLFFITFVYMCSVYFQIGGKKDGFSLITFMWKSIMLVKVGYDIYDHRGGDSDSFDSSNENGNITGIAVAKGEVGSNGQIKANPIFDGKPQKTSSVKKTAPVKKTSSVKKASPVKKTSSVKKASPVKKTSVKKAPAGRGPAAMAALRAASAKKRAT